MTKDWLGNNAISIFHNWTYLLKFWCRPTWSNTYEFGLEILRQTRFSSSLHIAYVDPNTRTSTCYGSAHFSGDIRSRLIDHSGERYTPRWRIGELSEKAQVKSTRLPGVWLSNTPGETRRKRYIQKPNLKHCFSNQSKNWQKPLVTICVPLSLAIVWHLL